MLGGGVDLTDLPLDKPLPESLLPAAAGTPEQLADAVEERYAAGVLDVIGLGGLGDPRTRDFVTNGLLPELRRRGIVGTDYVGGTFRENLELPALPDQRH
ncbi:xenobiotic compound DszA family monooxygenase [Mycobacteroides abscessus subsp. abscessus]|nr:xenobiotic compound DszA family monooxygenase [Mycobacteroides abscessus subsp. abscessus]